MSELYCDVPLPLMKNIVRALVDAKGNSVELLGEHDSSLGRTSKKNRRTAEMYEEEIAMIDGLISNMADNFDL